MRIDDALRDARRDVGLALRLLARRPGFAAVALITLALGIGAPTAIFSVVNAVLIKPLPYPQPERVVRFRLESETPVGPFAFDALPVGQAIVWSQQSRTLSALAIFNDRALTLTTADGPFRLAGISATPNLFELLGTQPVIGRTFASADVDAHQIVLSHAMWQRYFNADPTIVGTVVTLDGEAFRVTGVMPDGFRFPTPEALFWVPQVIDAGGSRGMVLPAIGRLLPNATVAAVVEEGKAFLGNSGDSRVKQTILAQTLQAQMVGGVSRVLWILMAAVAIVSVIATVNIALLLLTRGAGRAREFSIRLALGASRRRLIRQLFVEGLVLAGLGGLTGLALSAGGLKLLLTLAPSDLPRLSDASMDLSVLVFAMAITLIASVIFGFLSAGRMVAFEAVRGLAGPASESRLVASGPPRRHLHLLAALELGLTMVLLVGAGLLLRSFVALVLVPQGFTPSGAFAFGVNLPAARYPTAEARAVFLDRLHTALRALPGVQAAGLAAEMPNRQPTGRFDFSSAGIELFPDPMTRPTAETRMVSDGFFEAMGIAIRSGRAFTAADSAGSEPVIVISEMLARQQFKDRSAVGQTLYSGSGNRRVIGVVGDVRPAAEDATIAPAAYLPLSQGSGGGGPLLSWHSSMNIVVRTSRPAEFAASARALVLSLDPSMPVINMRPLTEEVSKLVAGPRFSATVLAIFAVIAFAMASLGVYGVMAYVVGQRTKEIGVRVALGATRSQILRLMMRDGVAVVLAGLSSGLVAAVWLARTLTGLLHDVTPADPVALITVGILLSSAGLIAAYVPARRATRLNVLTALRDE
jgi:putative ABC transport system permease protein